jgi:hypothetical protein
MDGAILLVKVPATIIRSECLGEGLNTTPNLSQSYLLTAECIISTAQQANPKVRGQSDPALAQLINVRVREVNHSTFILLCKIIFGATFLQK